jgi:lipid A 3-O-deacylase
LFSLPLIGKLRDIGYRVTIADGSDFDGLTRQALFLDFELPWTWSGQNGMSVSSSLSLELGRFSRDSEDRNFVSIGPSIRLTNDNWRKPFFVDLGLSPTVIDGSSYGDKEFGTSFNFTSHVALGMSFGKQKNHSVRLRYEHISNGGLDEANPGVNMIGIDFVLWAR